MKLSSYSLIILFTATTFAIGQTKYPDQVTPGTTPNIFAAGIISLPNQTEFGSVFSKDGTVFYYAVEPEGKAEIRAMKFINNQVDRTGENSNARKVQLQRSFFIA